MTNKILNGMAIERNFRFFIIDSKEMVQYLSDVHQTSPVATAALGRQATITAIMGKMLKQNQKLTSIIRGDGPIGQMIVTADDEGHVKATIINPFVDLPLKENGKLDVSRAVGNGELIVSKDLGFPEPYNGVVELVSGEIAEDFTYYFSQSEQVPTAISAGVLVDVDHSIKAAGALIIQVLPNATEEAIIKLEEAFLKMESMTTMLQKMNLEEILSHIFATDFEILAEMNVECVCRCDYDFFIQTLNILNDTDIAEIKEEETVECVCEFCKKKYDVKTADLREIVSK
ncbi:MAG: Hsp33 family molecular chaperone HslO [Mycoplasmatales bacterium]